MLTMTWERTPLRACSHWVNSRSFCIRFLVGLIIPIHFLLIWSSLALSSVSGQEAYPSHHYTGEQHWHSHPRTPLLCARTFDGLEGTAIKGFVLDRAFVLTTPGLIFRQHVDSLMSLGGYPRTQCHFHKFAKTHPSEKIKSYSEVFSMKKNVFKKAKIGSDFKSLKHVPLFIRCKDDMLTPQGIAQSVFLGEYLAKSYLNKLSTISSAFNNKGLAHSVGDELLYQSVQGVLYGLLTEKQFVHARVEKLSYHFTDDKTSRVEAQEHLSHYVKEAFRNEHHLFKDYSSPTGDRWSIDSEFGREISAKDVLSSLTLKGCDKITKGGVFLSKDLIESILSVSDEHNKYLLNSSIFYNYSKSVSQPFRKFLNSWLSASHKDNDFRVVSVDELFMLSILSVFGFEDIMHIPPVSRLVIERFHYQSSSLSHPKTSSAPRSDILASFSLPSFVSIPTEMSSYLKVQQENNHQVESKNEDPRNVYFRVLYNGKVVTADILNCRSDSLIGLGLCQMPRFVVSLMTRDVGHYKDEL